MIEILDIKNIGLRGVKVADTRISDVDGEKGMLIYRGFNVIELAQFSTLRKSRSSFLTTICPLEKN